MSIRTYTSTKRRGIVATGAAVLMIAAIACSGGSDNVDPVVANTISPGANSISTEPAIGAPAQVIGGVAPAVQPIGVSSSGIGVTAERSAGFSPSFSSAVSVNQQLGIWVEGLGSIQADPDIAILSLGIESREPTVTEARQAAAGAMQQLVASLNDEGVSSDDIATSSFNISPQTIYREVRDVNGSYSMPEIIGYIVSNRLTVTIRDLDNVGGVIDRAATEAGDLVRINNISFSIEDPSVFGADLRTLAATDARAKAQIYADAMGVELGPLVFLSESGSSAPKVYAEERAVMAIDASFAPTPIMAGETSLSARVQAVFSIIGS
jgi:hypothetical protein